MIVYGGSFAFAAGDYARSAYMAGKFREIVSLSVTTNEAEVTTSGLIASNNQITVGRRPITKACTVFYMACGYRA